MPLLAIPALIKAALGLLPTLAGLREGAGRWLNRETAAALAIAVVALCCLGGLIGLVHTTRRDAVAACSAGWERRLAAAHADTAKLRAARDSKADAAAEAVRTTLLADLQAEADRAVALERRLAEVQDALRRAGKAVDPVAIPKSLATELRK